MGYRNCILFLAGFKADVTSKMEMGMEFGRFPTFSGSGQVEWKLETLELCPRLLYEALFPE